jgi:hypothetical protein
MQTLLITIILTLVQPQTSLTTNADLTDEISTRVKVLAEKNNGNVNVVTGEIIDWLYSEKGFTETLDKEDIEILKDIVRIRCSIVESRKMALKAQADAIERKRIVDRMKRDDAKLKQEKVKTGPIKDWYDNVRLNVTYANGITATHTVRAYGYIDPNNPNNFIHDLEDQTPEVKNLVRGTVPGPVYIPVQQQYYYQQPSTYCVGGVCYPAPVRGGLFRR